MTISINKAVIACGGLGTRFLPVTKAVPKELLPIIDTPVLQYIVDEAVESGATDILIILSKGKDAIRAYLEPSPVLEERFLSEGKTRLYEQLKSITPKANISFTYQKSPHGSGDALLCAESFTKGEPFFLSYADDLMRSNTPALAQLKAAYGQVYGQTYGQVSRQGAHIVGVKRVDGEEIGLYGAARVKAETERGLFLCGGFEEKKPYGQAPSNLAVTGRYLFSPEIYAQLKRTPFVGGELRLTDAINSLCSSGAVYAKTLEGDRFDCGDRFGALTAAVEYGLERDFAPKLKEYLKNLVNKF